MAAHRGPAHGAGKSQAGAMARRWRIGGGARRIAAANHRLAATIHRNAQRPSVRASPTTKLPTNDPLILAPMGYGGPFMSRLALWARQTRSRQGREPCLRRRTGCSASLTRSMRSPSSPPCEEWRVANNATVTEISNPIFGFIGLRESRSPWRNNWRPPWLHRYRLRPRMSGVLGDSNGKRRESPQATLRRRSGSAL